MEDHSRQQTKSRNEFNLELLKPFAFKYIWWKSPEEAIQFPERIIAQVMNIGDYDDVQSLIALVGIGRFQEVISSAEAGQFNEKSWYYWHYRLSQTPNIQVPPLPARRVE